MRGLFSDVIADHVMGYILCFARNLHVYLQHQREAKWEPVGGESARSDFLFGNGVVNTIDRCHRHLSDCSIGVVGVGAIGSEILRRASVGAQGDLPEEALVEAADELFRALDAEEARHAAG